MYKTKEYKVCLKKDPNIWYSVEAPSKRIALWCGYNLFQNEYLGMVNKKDFVVVKQK